MCSVYMNENNVCECGDVCTLPIKLYVLFRPVYTYVHMYLHNMHVCINSYDGMLIFLHRMCNEYHVRLQKLSDYRGVWGIG